MTNAHLVLTYFNLRWGMIGALNNYHHLSMAVTGDFPYICVCVCVCVCNSKYLEKYGQKIQTINFSDELGIDKENSI